MFQRVKELEDENEMLKEKVQILEESSVRLTNFYLSQVLVFRSYFFFTAFTREKGPRIKLVCEACKLELKSRTRTRTHILSSFLIRVRRERIVNSRIFTVKVLT